MDLFVIPPLAMTDAMLADASMAEDDDTSAWVSGTTYAAGDRVHVVTTTLAKPTTEAWAAGDDLYWNAGLSVATTRVIAGKKIGKAAAAALAADATGSVAVHRVYESAQAGNLNHNPVSDAALDAPTWWVKVRATNRWAPFDDAISAPCEGTSDLVWNITPSSTVTSVAVLNVRAGSVRVSVAEGLISAGTVFTADTIVTSGGTSTYDEERVMVDNSGVYDAWTYCFSPIVYETEAVFQNVPAFAGSTLIIEVKAGTGASRSVGEIVLGYEERVARVLIGAQTGITDYSTKEADTFGTFSVVERVYADRTTYPLVMDTTDTRGVKRLLARLRATPAVYHTGEANNAYGLLTYGFSRETPFTLADGVKTFMQLEVEGLT